MNILAAANKLLSNGRRQPHELIYRAYVVDGAVTDTRNFANQTRPQSVGNHVTIESGCMFIDERDGARFTNLLNPFRRENPNEFKYASANGAIVKFDDFRFRQDALSGNIKNTSKGSLRVVFAPEHPVLKRIDAFYALSDEFRVGARVRPIARKKKHNAEVELLSNSGSTTSSAYAT